MKPLNTLIAVAVAWAITSAAPAHATMLSKIVTLDGNQDYLKDASVARVINNGPADDIIGIGDDLIGIIHLTWNLTDTPGTELLSNFGEADIAFALRITAIPQTSSSNGFSPGMVLFEMGTADGVLKSLFSDKVSLIDDTDAFVLLTDSKPVASDPVIGLSYTDAFNILDSADFQVEATGGFASGTNRHDDSDFVQAILYDYDNSGTITFDEYTSAGIGASSVVGSEAAGFTYRQILGFTPGSGTINPLPVVVNHLCPWTDTSQHDITLEAQLKVPTDTAVANGWHFQDSSDIYTNLTPEPGALVGMASMLLMGAAGSLRRRRKR